jgi:hypothetical protein
METPQLQLLSFGMMNVLLDRFGFAWHRPRYVGNFHQHRHQAFVAAIKLCISRVFGRTWGSTRERARITARTESDKDRRMDSTLAQLSKQFSA